MRVPMFMGAGNVVMRDSRLVRVGCSRAMMRVRRPLPAVLPPLMQVGTEPDHAAAREGDHQPGGNQLLLEFLHEQSPESCRHAAR